MASEKQRIASKKWDDKNRERLRQYKKEYYQKHKLELKIKRLTNENRIKSDT